MGGYIKKPGYMGRAVVAWFVLNAAMAFTLGVVVYFLGKYIDGWVSLFLVAVFFCTEAYITGNTIAPIVKDWINQESYVSDQTNRE